MTHPLEQLEPDEAAMIAEMTRVLRGKMAKDYARGATRRDAHPKTVGLLRGKFSIEPELPRELRIGLFKTARTFDCWVRVSNASGKLQSDSIPDARGFAIKLMQDGGKGLAGDAPLGQDFVLLSAPTMPLGTVALFRDAVHYAIESSPLLLAGKLLLTGQPGVLFGLAGLLITPSSPFDIRYWSTTPYRWGRHEVVKYALRPTSEYRSRRPRKPDESYLSEAMQAHLDQQPATFDFCVQLRREGMPVEDAAPRWDERKSPLLKVATQSIPKQKFRTAARGALAEALVFSPGHARAAHAALGGLNRARIKIYRALSRFRHTRDRMV